MTDLRAVSRASSLRGAALIVFASLLTFSNTFANGFHLDDFYRVVDNPGIQRVAPITRHFTDPRTMSTLDRITQFRPLLPLTLSLNFWWGGSSPASYHAFNLAVHVLAALLAYALLLELLRRGGASQSASGAALAAALMFAVHPVSGIVVNYVSARDLGMMQMFLLASLLTYARMRRSGDSALGWTLSLAFAFASILSKTNAVVVPLLVLAFELTVGGQDPRRRGPWLRAAAFGVVPAAYFAWTKLALGFSDLQQVEGGAAPLAYAMTQLKVHAIYLANFVWPLTIRQMPTVEAPGASAAVGLGLIVVSVVMAWRWRVSRPALAFSLCAYWILMLPESSFLPLHHLRSDYRPYPSSVFLFLLVAHFAATRMSRRLFVAAAAVATAALAAASFHLNRTWRTEETLWTHSVDYGGDEVAHMNLAMSIADRRDPRVRTHLEHAVSVAPGYVLAHVNYGLLLIELGERDRGVLECREAVRLAPRWAQAHYWLAIALERVSLLGEAADEARVAAELDPANLRYAYEAAQRAQRAGRYEESLRLLDAVEGGDADYPLTALLRAFALQKTGRIDESIASYRRYLAAQPGDAQARFNLAYALMTRGDCALAISEFQQVLRLRPEYEEARLHLATCQGRLR